MADDPLLVFESHISGKNAKVRIYSDRIEWGKSGGFSVGKITAGVLTGGMSLLATGVGKGSYTSGGGRTTDSEMLPIAAVTSVSTKKDGRYTIVTIATSSGAMELRTMHEEADNAKRIITELILRRSSQPTVVVAGPAAPVAPSGPSMSDLAAMYQQGLLTEEEFSAAKRKALGI